jgi:glucan-binding YG repeat protein
MKITKLAAVLLIFIMIMPLKVVQAYEFSSGKTTYTVEKSAQGTQAKRVPKIIVQYAAYANMSNDTSNYKIREDAIIENPSLDSNGYYTPLVPEIYGYNYQNGGTKHKIETSENETGKYYIITVHYNRIIGNDNPSKNVTIRISKTNEVKDVGYWEEKNGNWYFVQQRITELVAPIAGEKAYYYGYTLNGVRISANDGDYTKHYKTGPCWIKPDANWYHLDSTGKMETGWIKDGSSWYYLYSTGQMAYDINIGGYSLGSDGKLISL